MRVSACAAVIALTLLGACYWPTSDRAQLNAIKAAAQTIMETYPPDALQTVPETLWPPAIASLEPEHVMINAEGMHIMTKPFLDGGWGYLVVRGGHVAPEPEGRFREVAEGVYWWHPY